MTIKEEIKRIALEYSASLELKIKERKIEMQDDDKSHFLIYKILGISYEDGEKIDQYQNTGRFLYKYAGAFLEDITVLCLSKKFPDGKKIKIENTMGIKPKTFEIDFKNDNDAIEIKWRDATTDGDHITKEHTRVQAITSAGLKPIRIMFYYPQREQAKRIQETLKTLYTGVNGEYYAGEDAWNFITTYTGIDLKTILEEIAIEND
ncbi:MAG: ApaLI family restriction endonuclease [bacterium]